jgi:hypothetical protein
MMALMGIEDKTQRKRKAEYQDSLATAQYYAAKLQAHAGREAEFILDVLRAARPKSENEEYKLAAKMFDRIIPVLSRWRDQEKLSKEDLDYILYWYKLLLYTVEDPDLIENMIIREGSSVSSFLEDIETYLKGRIEELEARPVPPEGISYVKNLHERIGGVRAFFAAKKTFRRSELRANLYEYQKEDLQKRAEAITQLSQPVTFLIDAQTLQQMTRQEWLEFLGLKLINRNMIKVLILPSENEIQDPRIEGLLANKDAEMLVSASQIPHGVFTVHFSDLSAANSPAQMLDEKASRLVNAYFGVYEGAFGTARLYALASGNLEGLRQKNGRLYDPDGIYIGEVLRQLWSNYEIIAYSA